jgi:hypothetical protein
LENTRELFMSYLEKIGIAWWIEIVTEQPKCIYYFGPFDGSYEAQLSSKGYLDDLEQEEAQVIAVDIKPGEPRELTIFENELGATFYPQLARSLFLELQTEPW